MSLGGAAFEPQDDDDIDSQELSIFGGRDISKANESMDDDMEGAFIENMGAFGLCNGCQWQRNDGRRPPD